MNALSETDYLTWLRRHIGPRKTLLVYTSACIQDERGALLLQLRADLVGPRRAGGHQDRPDRAPIWGLPGGIMEPGESLSQCLIREVREETGLEVQPTRLIGLYTSPDFDVTYPNGDQVQQVTACFACRVVGGALRPDGEESRELAYFPLDDLPPLPSWYAAMVDDLRAGRETTSFRRGRPLAEGRNLNETGKVHFRELRRYVGSAMLIMPAAAGFLQDEAGRVLLIRRRDDGEWAVPGGAMELGERIDQTVIREVYEETGVRFEPTRLVGLYSGPDLQFVYPNGDAVHVVSAFFAGRIVGGSPRADGVESTEVRFFAPDELPPMLSRHRRRVEDGLAGRRWAVFD